jgi:predicted TIM-barrel fold metal-dependent hydrolase
MSTYYSCDSHVVEPPEVFAGLEARFGSRAPRILQNPEGKRGTYIAFGKAMFSVGRLGIAGHRLDDPATQELMARGYEGLNPGVYDPVARLKVQAVDGIVGEVVYPGANMLAFSYPERDVVHALFCRYNDWLREYCSHAPGRLVGIACLPLPDVDAAIHELERTAHKGFHGFAIPCSAPPDKPYSHPDYEPFWQAAEESGFPLSMHIFCGSTLDMGLPAHWGSPTSGIVGYTMAHGAIVATIAQLICSGVAERHPRLTFVCCEFETGWLAHVLQRLDHATYRAREEASPDLTMPPSAYFRRQFHATFEDDQLGVMTRHAIGVDNLIWGNDYPHHDSIWPHSQEVLERIFQGVPTDEKDKMTSGNVRKLYGITVPLSPMT